MDVGAFPSQPSLIIPVTMPTIRPLVLTEVVMLSGSQSLVLANTESPLLAGNKVRLGSLISQVWDLQLHLGTFGSLSPRVLMCVRACVRALQGTSVCNIPGPAQHRQSLIIWPRISGECKGCGLNHRPHLMAQRRHHPRR